MDDDYDDLDYIAPIREEDGSNNQRNHTFKSSRDAEVFDNLDDYVEKPKPKPKKSASKKPKAKAKAKSSSKKAKVEEPAEEEYEDFTDDFFDDGVFGDEGYESLLDDYEKPKSKSRKSSKRQSEEEYTVYDYERKGADSVFNLDDD